MKYFMIFVILIASAYAAEQQPTPNPIYELANMSFQLGIAYQQAQQSQDVTIYNSLVDQYNTWVREHLAEGGNVLLKSKITATNSPGIVTKDQVITNKTEFAHIYEKNPFNASSELSKFGKQQIMLDLGPGGAENIEQANTNRILENF
jgi:hypothetical protein